MSEPRQPQPFAVRCYRRAGRLRGVLFWKSLTPRRLERRPPWPPRRGFNPERLQIRPAVARLLKGSGLSLAALFDAQLARDPEIAEMVGYGSGHVFHADEKPYYCDGRCVLEREYREKIDEWPAVLAGHDLFVEWCDNGGYQFPGKHGRERVGLLNGLQENSVFGAQALRAARGAARVVSLRYDAVMRALRNGQLAASGHRPNGDLTNISPAIWADDRTLISFNRSEVGRPDPNAKDKFVLLWFGVVVNWHPVAAIPIVEDPEPAPKEVEQPEPQADVGGRPQEKLWEDAYEEFTVILGTEGFPASGKKSDLAEMFLRAFENIGAVKPAKQSIGRWMLKNHIKIWKAME